MTTVGWETKFAISGFEVNDEAPSGKLYGVEKVAQKQVTQIRTPWPQAGTPDVLNWSGPLQLVCDPSPKLDGGSNGDVGPLAGEIVAVGVKFAASPP